MMRLISPQNKYFVNITHKLRLQNKTQNKENWIEQKVLKLHTTEHCKNYNHSISSNQQSISLCSLAMLRVNYITEKVETLYIIRDWTLIGSDYEVAAAIHVCAYDSVCS